MRIMYPMIRLVLILVLALINAPAFAIETTTASEAVQPMVLQYKGFWGGIEAANITLSLEEDHQKYQSKFAFESKGLIKKILRLYSSAENSGTIKNDSPTTSEFTSTVSKRKKEKKYWWRLDPKTGVARVPDENNEDTEKTIPESMRQHIYDPLSVLLKARNLIREARIKNDWSVIKDKILPVYDGRRRYDISLQDIAEREDKVAGQMRKVIDITLSIVPVAGFKSRDADIWQNTKIHAFLSDDDRHIPLRIQASTPIAPAVIMLQSGL
ncbi:MAG: DUF3108 domain-containing protein [Alphaproteobacteria bacterium]|nr:MAG: DUF3108 domain-containing protein [Alphaproteobacteria bacterium]